MSKSEYTLTPDEINNLIYTAKTFRDRVLIKIMYHQGLRVREASQLEIQHIDFHRKVIHIKKSKYGKTRTLPVMDSSLLSDLQMLIGKNDKGRVFAITPRRIQYIISETGKKAKIQHPDPLSKHLNPHLLRHSIARHLKSKGYALEFVQKFLGHSSIKTTGDVYGTLSVNEMQQIIARKTQDHNLLPSVKSHVPELL